GEDGGRACKGHCGSPTTMIIYWVIYALYFWLSMRSPRPQNYKPTRAAPKIAKPKIAQHLAKTPHEFAVTRFEQGLICAAAAFYRFYGVLLGREGRVRNISGQDNAILQQIMAASRPLAVTDIARFANRDDIANIQYSLKKLLRAKLLAKSNPSSARETTYAATELARELTRNFVVLRRTLFTSS